MLDMFSSSLMYPLTVTLSATGQGDRDTFTPKTLLIPDCGNGEITSSITETHAGGVGVGVGVGLGGGLGGSGVGVGLGGGGVGVGLGGGGVGVGLGGGGEGKHPMLVVHEPPGIQE